MEYFIMGHCSVIPKKKYNGLFYPEGFVVCFFCALPYAPEAPNNIGPVEKRENWEGLNFADDKINKN